MGKSLALVGLIAAGVSAGASIIGGIQQKKAADEQAENASREAELRARAEARENIALEQRQKVAFLNSGVSLEGSPLLVLQETKRRGSQNVGAITESGRTRASSIRASGRQALIGGLAQGASTAVSGYSGFKEAGGSFGGGGSSGVPIPSRKPI